MPQTPFGALYPETRTGTLGTSPGATTPTPSSAPANPAYPGLPAGATPIHRDLVVSAAGTVAIWTPAVGKRFVLLGLVVASDTLMRVKVVDASDVPGRRIIDGWVPANGGITIDLAPVPYVATAVDQELRLVTAAAGTVTVSVWGYES